MTTPPKRQQVDPTANRDAEKVASRMPADDHATDELREHIGRDPPAVVHHYTSQRGLLGIVTHAEIWATSINNLNDAREFEHAKSVAIDLIDKRLGEANETEKRHLGYLRHAAETAGINICVCSWSTNADDLSQWRAYSGAGTGYSIDMSGAALRRFAAAQDFIFAACVYDAKEQERLLNGLIDANLISNISREEEIAEIPDREEAERVKYGGNFGYHINRYAALFKDGAFANEQEWRLISRPTGVDRMCFREGQSTIVSYFPFSLRDDEDTRSSHNPVLRLESVHVGPCPSPELAKGKVQFLLAKHSPGVHHPDVISSKVPYRTW